MEQLLEGKYGYQGAVKEAGTKAIDGADANDAVTSEGPARVDSKTCTAFILNPIGFSS